MSASLWTDQLGCRMPDGRWLWRDLTFSLGEGESLAIVGPTGSGKTRLLRILALLDEPAAGSLGFQGRPVAEWDVRRYRSAVGYLCQEPQVVSGGWVEEELALLFGFAAHRGRHFDREHARILAERFGRSAEFLTLPTETLSGGEKAILALIRALQTDPCVLLLDELTAALDPEASEAVERFLLDWVGAAAGRALLWVTHDAAQRQRVCTRQIALGAP